MSSIGLAPFVPSGRRTSSLSSTLGTIPTSVQIVRPTDDPQPEGPQGPGPKRRGPRKRVDHRTLLATAGRALTTSLVIVALAAFLGLAVGPHVFGYRTATMLTGSMAPSINPGDIVVAFPAPASTVKQGDVISYHIPVEDHRVETHRIVDVKHAAGSTVVRTKGDANNGVDPWTAKLEGNTVWKVRTVVPHVGTAIRALRTPVIQEGIFWGALTLLVGGVLVRIWRTPSEPEGEPTGSATARPRTRNHAR